jgi:hypothetical protein
MESKVYGVYAPEHDLTFVMEEKFTDSGEPYTLEVKGFYYGAPDDEATKIFYGDLIARFAPKPQTTTKREYLVHLTVEVDDNRTLEENDVQSLIKQMPSALSDGTNIKCTYAHHEEV